MYQVAAVTILDRVIGIFSLCLLAVAAAVVLMVAKSAGGLWLYILIFLGCMTPALGFYFFKPLSRVLRWLVRAVFPRSWGQGGSSILDYLGEFKLKRRLILALMLLSVVIQAMRVLTHVLIALALGIPVDGFVFGLFFVFVPVLSLAMIPPITINGLGIREALGIVLLAQAGIGRTDAFAVEFLTYVVSVVISLFGLMFFVGRRPPSAGSRANGSRS